MDARTPLAAFLPVRTEYSNLYLAVVSAPDPVLKPGLYSEARISGYLIRFFVSHPF